MPTEDRICLNCAHQDGGGVRPPENSRGTCHGCPELKLSPGDDAGYWCELTGEQLDAGLYGPWPCCDDETDDDGERAVRYVALRGER